MKEITLKAVTGNIPQVIAFVEEQLETVACPLRAQMQIDVAVDEMFSNISRYAYAPETGEATVRFAYDEMEKAVYITENGLALAEFLPKTLELEETMTLYEEEVGDQGFFFSGADTASDDHYHVILKYALF